MLCIVNETEHVYLIPWLPQANPIQAEFIKMDFKVASYDVEYNGINIMLLSLCRAYMHMVFCIGL